MVEETAIRVQINAAKLAGQGIFGILQAVASMLQARQYGQQSIQSLNRQSQALASVELNDKTLPYVRRQLKEYSVDFAITKDKDTGQLNLWFKGQDVDRIQTAIENCMAIAEVPLKKVFCTPRNYLPVALRLIVVPIIVLLLLRVFHASDWIADGKAILMTVYLSAITPSCATVTSMAQLYNRDAAHSSALYVLSTLLSIMTMPLMIGLFDMLV